MTDRPLPAYEGDEADEASCATTRQLEFPAELKRPCAINRSSDHRPAPGRGRRRM